MKFYTFLISVTVFLLVGCNLSKEIKPLIEVTAIQLLNDYSKNELAADKKYKDQIIEITGDVANVSQIRGTVGVLFEDYNSMSKFVVFCFSDKPEAKEFHNLRRGQPVTFVGSSKGKVSDSTIQITDCIIKNSEIFSSSQK